MRYTIVLLLMLFTLPLVADGDEKNQKTSGAFLLEGTIKDKDSGEYLAGVMVEIDNTDKMTYTDFEGKFELSVLKPGRYKIKTDYISYEEKRIEANLSSSSYNKELEILIEKQKPL